MLLAMLMRKLSLVTFPSEGASVRWVRRDDSGDVLVEGVMTHRDGQIDFDVYERQDAGMTVAFSETVRIVADGKVVFSDAMEGPSRIDFFVEAIAGAVVEG